MAKPIRVGIVGARFAARAYVSAERHGAEVEIPL